MRYRQTSTAYTEPSFWDILRQFWSEERVDAWYNTIFASGTEVCYNLMCLCPNAHTYWEKACFALKPIRLSDDKKHLDIQLFWLPLHKHSSGVDILRTPSLPEGLDQGPNRVKLFNCETDKKICSGDEISLETDDPVTRPLPDLRLLEMQWILHRVAAMSGATEPRNDVKNDNDDDNGAMALQNEWDSYMEDEWDPNMEDEWDSYMEESIGNGS